MRSSIVLGMCAIFLAHTTALPSISLRSDSLRPSRWFAALVENSEEVKPISTIIDPPRITLPPVATSEGGWLTRWLNVGGEGSVMIQLDTDRNFTVPHRPSAFPSQLFPPLVLPLEGFLVPFQTLLNSTSDPSSHSSSSRSPSMACLPSLYPRFVTPTPPYTIALIERGECDFATKVRSAQERGAAGVIVGDGKLKDGESDEEGMKRENLITMFSPEDTDSIVIPSVFVSRASYLVLSDLLANEVDSERKEGPGLWIEIGEGIDEGGALSSLLSFALLMPSLFLLTTIAIHRIRVARQREAERAPPLLVLSLPERFWSPDIVWEKDSDTESISPKSPRSPKPGSPKSSRSPVLEVPPPSPISPAEIPTPPLGPVEPISGPSHKKKRSKSGISAKKKYFSKDECAICMDSFQSGEIVRILPCGHVFHKDECDEWLLKWRKLCPTCRADVTLPPGEVGSGTTLTPVAIPVEGENVQRRSLTERVTEATRHVWDNLTGRSAIRLDAGERTPLVERSPAGSPRASRSEEV